MVLHGEAASPFVGVGAPLLIWSASKSVVCVLAAGLLVSCSPTDPQSAESMAKEVQADDARPEELDLWTASALSVEKLRTVHLGIEREVRACMEARGHQYLELPFDPLSVQSYWLSPEQLRHGYGLTAAALSDHGRGPNEDMLDSLESNEEERWRSDLFGANRNQASERSSDGNVLSASTDGCVSTAWTRVYGSVQIALRLKILEQELGGGAAAMRVRADKRYALPLAAWKTCMAGQGFPIEGDTDYGHDVLLGLSRKKGASEALASQQSIAQADGQCQASSRLFQVRSELLVQLNTLHCKKFSCDPHEILKWQRDAATRAEAVLSAR